MRRGPAILTGACGILMVAVANLAALTGIGTRAPWFSATVSLQAYSLSLAVAAILTGLLAAMAASRAFQLDEILRTVEVRLAEARDAGFVLPDGAPLREPVSGGSSGHRNANNILDELEELAPPPVVRLETRQAIEGARSAKRPGYTVQLLMVQHQALQSAREAVWGTVASPIFVSIVFLVIAGIMLPGSEGFAVSNFRLNTTLILLLMYGWPILVAWAAAAVALLPSVRERKAVPIVSP